MYGFNTHMLKLLHLFKNLKFFNFVSFQLSSGIICPNFIILGQKMGSTAQKSIFWKKNWKSLKKLKIAISQPLIVLDQNPLGWKDYLGKGSKPCPNCMDISELKFLHLVTSKKNGHLMFYQFFYHLQNCIFGLSERDLCGIEEEKWL